MNRLCTLLVLALAIACVAAQGAGRRGGGRAGASGGSSSDFGAEDAFFATDQQETNVNALDRNAAEARTEVDAESRDAAAVDAQSIDEASVDAGAREANRANFDSQSQGGARGYKNVVAAQNLDFAAKDDFTNRVGVSYGLDEGGSDRVAVSASSGDALNQNQQVLFGEDIHAASFDNQQALAEADVSDAALVRGADEAASNLNAGEAAAVEDNFALSAGDARRSGVSSNSGVFGAEEFGGESGFGGGFGDSVFSGFGGGSVFGGRDGFGGGGGFGNRGSGVLSLIGDRGFGGGGFGGSSFGGSGFGGSGFGGKSSFFRRRR